MKETAITWTDATFNPWWGCVEVSPACDHCYARAFDKRIGGEHWGKDAPRRFFKDDHWKQPEKWNAVAMESGVRLKVFSGSMCDIGERRPDLDAERARLIDLIDRTPWLDWLLLTKRAQSHRLFPTRANVWRGVTVENADYTWRVDELRKVDAAVRFISYEPALGPIADAIDLTGIDWIVCGDESGAGRRPAEVQWFRDLRDKAEREGVAFHLKQWAGSDADGIEGPRSGKTGKGPRHLPVLDGRQHGAFPEVKP